MDVVIASGSLLIFSPLLLLIGIAIKAASPGPALFKQQRIGRFGKAFGLWKFRTMRPDADSGLHQTHLTSLMKTDTPMTKLDAAEDPRVFRLGKYLRRCCLDELPQLINVLRGEMSLVGPRPCLPYEAEQYEPWHRQRFNATPGMTGLWQVSGKNRTTFTEMIRLDIEYANNVSFLLDVTIIMKTIPSIIAGLMDSAQSLPAAAARKDA
jgi:exopolysaccharide production protein ExoY